MYNSIFVPHSLKFTKSRQISNILTVIIKSMKTEKEKMLSGEYYDPLDKSLSKERLKTRKTLYKYNTSKPVEKKKREKLIKKLIPDSGNNVVIEPPFNCDYGHNIKIGDNFFANFNCVFLDVNKISIGSNCLIASNVQIYSATHPVEPDLRLAGKELGLPISIGDNVWIGGGSIICPGVKIGNNVTIGAGSVVTHDIPDDVVAAGNPCRILRNVSGEKERSK
jgi:maltose O-acetyltransferase